MPPARSKPSSQAPFNLDAFSSRFAAETDRGCGVLGAALLDDRLCSLLTRRLLTPKDDLLGQEGPLGTFSARIKMARALAWISEDVGADLDAIRRIRNKFAHSFDHDLGFSDHSISTLCRNLKTSQAFIDGYDDAAIAPGRNVSSEVFRTMQATFTTARWRYQLAVEFIAQYLDDVPDDVPVYAGSDLLKEVRALSARTQFKISARGSVGPREPGSQEQ